MVDDVSKEPLFSVGPANVYYVFHIQKKTNCLL